MGDASTNTGGLRLAASKVAEASPPLLVSPPTADQDLAIAILRSEKVDVVFAWLKFARSLQGTFQHCAGHGCLSMQQVRAIVTLQECSDDSIRAWLEPNPTDLRDGQELQNLSVLHASQLRTIETTEAAVPSHNSPQYAPAPSLGFPVFASEGSQSILNEPSLLGTATHADHLYFCTICPTHKPFKNLSEWRRHERGHEITYICMLGGPREITTHGIACVICGSLDLAERHLEGHKVNPCAEQQPSSFSCKRRNQMVAHLSKQHKVYDEHQGRVIADKWKSTSGKRAWSCCFCVKLFTHHDDRLKHISTEHFRPHQKASPRNATNVIKGLLLQPAVNEAWHGILAESFPGFQPNIFWANGAIDDLQSLLEKGTSASQSPETLAEAALAGAKVSWDISGSNGSTFLLVDQNDLTQESHGPSQLPPDIVPCSTNTSFLPFPRQGITGPFTYGPPGSWSADNVPDDSPAEIDPMRGFARLCGHTTDTYDFAFDDFKHE